MAEIINSYDNGSEIKVVYSYTQNQASNTSTITMTLYVHRDSYGPSWDQECEAYIKLDGTKVMTYGGAFEIGSSWVKIGTTVSKTVTHSSTGEKTVSIEGFFDGYGVSVKVQDLKCSGSVKLKTIPRGSSISSITGSTIGEPVTVKISREVSSFTHKVYYTLGNVKNRLLGSDVGTSLTFTPPMSDCEQITGSAKGTATIRVDTYNGSTKIGSSSKNFTLNVPASVVPSFTDISFTRIDGDVPESWGVYVQGKSKVTAAITGAAGAYGSTIKSYSISGGGYSGTESSLTTGVLKEAGEITFTAKITDSRGRTATKTASITVVAYAAPTLSSIVGFRCDAGGTEQDDGEYISLTANFLGASVNGYNTITGRYRTMPEGGSWSGYSNLVSGKSAVFAASGDFTFTVQVEVSDAFTSFTREIIVNSIRFIMDFKAGGNGIAFGKAAEYDDQMDVNWDIRARKNLQVDGEILKSDGQAIPVIVESGTDGIWTYRKWSDGNAECWGNYEYKFGINEPHTKWGSNYYITEPTPEITYPFTFIDTPVVQAAMFTSSGYGTYWLVPRYKSTLTKTPTYFATRSTENAQSGDFIISYAVYGKWK